MRLDDLGRLQQAEGVEDLGQDPGHGGLPGAGRAEEHEVPHRPLGADAGHRAPPRRLDGRGDRADLLLDRGEPDHRVEFGHRVLDRDRGLRPGGTALVVAGGVLRVGQRRGLRPHTRGGSARMTGGGRCRAGGRVSRAPGRRLFPCVPAAIHPGVLDALGHSPAEHGRGQQPRSHRAEERQARCRLEGDDASRHRPGQDPGDRTARHEPAGQRLGVGGQRDQEGQQDHRVEPGSVALVGEREHHHAPQRDADGRADGAPGLGHRDDAVDHGDEDDRSRQENSGDDREDLEPDGKPPVGVHHPGTQRRLVRRGGLGPILWQHYASLPLCPCLPRAQAPRTRLPDSRMSLYSV